MECVKNKYTYKNRDISFLVIKKIEQVVSIIAEKENKSFEDAYQEFLSSPMYDTLQSTNTLMWFETAEFIAEEYLTAARGAAARGVSGG